MARGSPTNYTVDEVLDAVLRVFARRRMFLAVSPARVSEESEVPRWWISRHIGDQEALLQAAIAREESRLCGQLERDAGPVADPSAAASRSAWSWTDLERDPGSQTLSTRASANRMALTLAGSTLPLAFLAVQNRLTWNQGGSTVHTVNLGPVVLTLRRYQNWAVCGAWIGICAASWDRGKTREETWSLLMAVWDAIEQHELQLRGPSPGKNGG